jgi:16S rRNA (cytidine1402-2'-O)-methyltransferase
MASQAGCPPSRSGGLVEAAHREGFRVMPLVGSSITLALMASGLEGQRFAFCGYLPREKPEREARIRELEKRSRKENETEIFIETPYRNEAMMESLLAACSPTSKLCVAADLTLETELVQTRSIHQWRSGNSAIGRRPAVFLLLADAR